MKNQKGQAAILIIFVLCMISVFIGISLLQTGFGESLMGRANPLSAKAFYIANSGVEEALYQLNKNSTYTGTNLTMTEGQTTINVFKDVGQADSQRTIESSAKSGLYIRKIKTTTDQSSGFGYAIEAGTGGLNMDNNTTVNGNVYSNDGIQGKNSNCGGSGSSKINGNGAAVNNINDVCVTGTSSSSSPSITLPVSPTEIQTFKNYVSTKTIFNKNCNPTGLGGTNDCSVGVKENGTPVIGNTKIIGNLTVNNNLKFSGPVWVTGQITFDSTANVGLTDTLFNDPKKLGQMVIADQEIIVNKPNVTFTTQNGVFLLLLSTSPTNCSGNNGAISLKQNTSNVLFYAKYGCVQVNQNVSFNGGIIGDSINMQQNTSIDYNSGLATAKFSLTDNINLNYTGPWKTTSFKEE
jgi:hypothetical protein